MTTTLEALEIYDFALEVPSRIKLIVTPEFHKSRETGASSFALSAKGSDFELKCASLRLVMPSL